MVMLGLLPLLVPTAPAQPAVPTIAVLPIAMKEGTETARETVQKTFKDLLEKSGNQIVEGPSVVAAWQNLGQKPFDEDIEGDETYPEMPTPKDLLSLGKKLKVDYVLASRLKWHTKSVWVGLGPKTKADCTIDVTIVDVKKSEISLNATDVKTDSTKKENGLAAAGALLVTPLFTVVSGGPKTPHQQRAGQLAVAKALEPWLESRVSKKID
ncbi:hypothetical protein BH11ARM2_BH11ARM2_17630 [soil metagenome]